VTAVMGAIVLLWCLVSLAVKGATNPLPSPEPRLVPRMNHTIDPPHQIDPMGFLAGTDLARQLQGVPVLDEEGNQVRAKDRTENPVYTRPEGLRWLSVIGLIGLFIAFGHSILAMSGEETLAQVYREVESPKLPNFMKAAFIVFIFSLIFTGGIS